MHIMKLTAWRDEAELFANEVNRAQNSKFRLSNMDVTPIKMGFEMGSTVKWEATLKGPLSIEMIEAGAPTTYVLFWNVWITGQADKGHRRHSYTAPNQRGISRDSHATARLHRLHPGPGNIGGDQ